MSAMSVFKMGFLSIMTATGLFVASNGLAADAPTTSSNEGVKAKAVSGDLRVLETSASRWQVADSQGKVYILIPLEIKDGKTSVEHVHPYTMPTSH